MIGRLYHEPPKRAVTKYFLFCHSPFYIDGTVSDTGDWGLVTGDQGLVARP